MFFPVSGTRRELPSYIPAHNFALALLDIAESVAFCAFDLSDSDHTQARALVEKWFDTSMVRVSGWYRRHTGKLLLVIGLVLAALLNVDAIHVARDLYRGAGLSIGWPDESWPAPWFAHVVGWTFTALAVSLGAPFWFDALGRVTKIRSTIKPSDDPPAAPAAAALVRAPEPPSEAPQPDATSELPQSEAPIELPHEWAVGWPKRGNLMSAGRTDGITPISDLRFLAPAFRQAVAVALADCRARGLDAMVYETFRSRELQALYFARGRTVVPPIEPVTNAASNLFSWHGYGLAVDVISASRGWNPDAGWFEDVADRFRAHDCRWGGEWKKPDLPHFQWRWCKPSPSDRARELIARGGVVAVWEAVAALE